VISADSSVLLSTNGALKDKVTQEFPLRNYTFYSITAFNLTVNLLYGKIQVNVTDPSGKLTLSQIIKKSTTLNIPHNNKTEDFAQDFYSSYTEYFITIEWE